MLFSQIYCDTNLYKGQYNPISSCLSTENVKSYKSNWACQEFFFIFKVKRDNARKSLISRFRLKLGVTSTRHQPTWSRLSPSHIAVTFTPIWTRLSCLSESNEPPGCRIQKVKGDNGGAHMNWMSDTVYSLNQRFVNPLLNFIYLKIQLSYKRFFCNFVYFSIRSTRN